MKARSPFHIATLAAILVAAVPSLVSAQSVITQWNFNSTVPDANTGTGVATPSAGVGMLTAVGGITMTFAPGSPADPFNSGGDNTAYNTTTYPAQGANSGTAGLQFSASTVGFTSPQISLDFRQSGTASRYFQLQLSTDGVSFVNASGGTASITTIPTNNTLTAFDNNGLYTNNAGGGTQTFVQGITYSLGANSPYANDANFAFRWVAIFDPTGANGNNYIASNAGTSAGYGTTGTARFDDVTISGTAATTVPEPSTYGLLLVGGFGIWLAVRRRSRVA